MKYGNSSVWKKVLGSPFSLVLLLVLVYVLGRAVLNIYHKADTSESRLAQAQMELSKLGERKNVLTNKVSQLSTEQGIEAEVRTKFHAVKEGESVAVIIDGLQSVSANSATLSSATVSTNSLSWWQRLLHLFGL
ncbi:MAG: hypothetical protein RL536_442 [Candidatus Parcubacteria bacterium]|jgi:cell division protein FtsB